MQEAFTKKCNGLTGEFILFLSRIHEKKGVDLLINAYLTLASEGEKLPLLVIAGPGLETPYGQEMQQLAAGNKSIYFPGMLAGDAKWGGFYSCEAFILPSHQENFGIAVVEALACAKPVLISDQVNICREIDREKAGIVENDTDEGAYKMLKRWLKMTSVQKKQTALNARMAFDTHFTMVSASRKMVNALDQVSLAVN
jgi:glycosyltransferase involved in cell wall biosynthesis